MRAPAGLLVAAALSLPALAAPSGLTGLDGRADAIVDLRTADGARSVAAVWKYADATIVPIDFRAPGADLKPTGAKIKTFDLTPRAGSAEFDDTSWPALDPASLEARKTSGKLGFGWYRLHLTIPPRVGAFETAGTTAVLEVVVDDYAEVTVDGRFPVILGGSGGTIRGYNAPQRVVLGRDLRPGQAVTVAILGINGPFSDLPANYVWIRSATLDFYKPQRIEDAHKTAGRVERLEAALDAVIAPGAVIEKVAGGFEFTEGPVWHPDGYLLFSDPNANTIYRLMGDGDLSVYRAKSGYTGTDIGEYGQPGSNGLALDREGRLTIDEHGNRRVTRLERNGTLTVLADRYQGKRLNSPNDLVYRSDDALYFTDPPFGLPKFFDDARKELPYSGVYLLKDGALTLLTTELSGPNGLAFSPDEKFLYVDDWDEKRKVVMRYPVSADGTLEKGEVFFDMKDAPEPEALDGLKVDRDGNLYVSGPGGVWVLSADGKHLGTIKAPELPANFAFGGDDRKTLYMTARTGVYRVRVQVAGK
ncbi:MAG TPA: SMP-30/gluconolactonase/LRE family protein [Candidatus Polarisedimenticolaceae bacterium]|nr:SMP-30/gluconolactonase/LRE family protein [Candidatus Polarisedimenticolaceae bacterium]